MTIDLNDKMFDMLRDAIIRGICAGINDADASEENEADVTVKINIKISDCFTEDGEMQAVPLFKFKTNVKQKQRKREDEGICPSELVIVQDEHGIKRLVRKREQTKLDI